MGVRMLLAFLVTFPLLFITYRKIEFFLRARKARRYGGSYVQKPRFIGMLGRWIKREPLDVRFYKTLFDRYGSTFTTHPLLRPLVMTADPENVKAILATQYEDFNIGFARTELGQQYMRKGVFTTQGAAWHESRTYLRPAFNKATYVDLDYLEGNFKLLLQTVPSDGEKFDLQPLLFAYTLNNISSMLFGVTVEDLGYSEAKLQEFHDAEASMRVIGLRVLHLSTLSEGFARLYRSRVLERAGSVFDKFVDDLLAKGVEFYRAQEKKGGISRYVFLDDAMDRTNDLIRFKHEATNVLFAGRDTGAVLMSNIFFTLARRPDMWNILQKEVAQLNGRNPTYDDLKGMKYLNNVLKEANRLFPVIPFNYREALKDTTLPTGGGPDKMSPLFIAKGSYAFYCTYAMHRDTSIYGSDADEFRPDRWNDSSLRPGWGYLPFNGGPRICLGQNLALTEMGYTITRMIQEFGEIQSEDPLPFQPSTHFIMSNINGAKISLKRTKH